ncbi:MAG: Mor transcription activator family protein [Rhodocyclaceae bacterium]|nr:Mor transcription activator family protein [Rhodocyclaceae bacterium]
MRVIEKPVSRKKGPEVLAYFAMILSQQLEDKGIEEKSADDIALSIMDRMKREFGGQTLYFPKDIQGATLLRNDALYDKFQRNEGTIEELAHEFDISIQRVYQIINGTMERRRMDREAQREAEKAATHAAWKKENF